MIDSLKDSSDCFLGIRDDIGASFKKVFLVKRKWSGVEPGDGTAKDVSTALLPTPRVVEFSHTFRVLEGGSVQQGDILLKGISKHKYPSQCQVDGSADGGAIENFYLVGDFLYKVISVTEKLLTWNVQLRKLSSQKKWP